MEQVWSAENKYSKWLIVEQTVLEAMASKGLIPQGAVENIRIKAKFDIDRIDEIEQVVKHDVIAFLTNVAEYVGEDARYIHLGLTSSDIIDTGLALQMREACGIIINDLETLAGTLKEKAYQFKDTIMMGRSHGIHAEPITFGLKLTLWYSDTIRNIKRMQIATETISYGKISGAVGTFANIDPDIEEYVCDRLSLKPDPISTQIIQRDRHAEFLTTLALIAACIEKIAVEIRHLQRTEVLEAEEMFSKGQKGSSAMPHKRNPVISEQLSGLARVLRANATASLENIALWHERDISHSSVERIIIPDSTILLDYMLDKLNSLIKNLQVYPENMKNNMEKLRGVVYSQHIMLELVKRGISREDAYKMVQKIAMEVWHTDHFFKEMILNSKEIKDILSKEVLEECFDVRYHLRNIDKIYDRVFNQ